MNIDQQMREFIAAQVREMLPEIIAQVRREPYDTEDLLDTRAAARVLGVETVEFLGFPDGEIEDTRESRLAVTAAIRRHRPDRLIIQNPHRTRNLGASHRDHRTVAGIALDCVYPLARDHMAFPELLAQGLEPHKVREIYLMWWDDPQTVIDISDTIDLKIKALACHASQFKDFGAVERRVRERAAFSGKPRGYAYAETFDVITLDR